MNNEYFGEYDPEKAKKYSREEYTVYEWQGLQLKKRTYTRKYVPQSKNGYKDDYTSEVL